MACRQRGDRLLTYEILPAKIKLAQETLVEARVESLVQLVQADARTQLENLQSIAFCFLDAEKDVYLDCYELVVPRLTPGGLLLADNFLSHQQELQPVLDRAQKDDRVDALVVPIGKGLLFCRRL